MAEDHGYQAPEGHRLCANNCGLSGNPATQNYCSECYRDMNPADPVSPPAQISPAAVIPARTPAPTEVAPPQTAENRCRSCRKKVGLVGFRCRCGSTFCGSHRYPEMHGCDFDFKAVGRQWIAKANPLIKAEKLLHKI